MSKKIEKTNNESKISKFKELWANPRYKALMKLGMYAVFFLSLFLIAYISSSIKSINNPVQNDNEEIISNLESYNYVYVINTKKADIIETITYTGTETSTTNSGTIKYSNDDKIDNYVVDKTTNKIYVNGIESEKLYDLDDESYFSLNDIKEKITKSKKVKENEYVYTDENNIKINITVEKTSETQVITMNFNEKYISETVDGKTLVLKYMSIK